MKTVLASDPEKENKVDAKTGPGCRLSTLIHYPFAGMPGETAQAICCMIFGGVLERYPRLKVCFAHGGNLCPVDVK